MTIYEKIDTLTAREIRGNLEKFIFVYGEKAAKTLGLEKNNRFFFLGQWAKCSYIHRLTSGF